MSRNLVLYISEFGAILAFQSRNLVLYISEFGAILAMKALLHKAYSGRKNIKNIKNIKKNINE